jgi:membrane associated rhomboid family serine protease
VGVAVRGSARPSAAVVCQGTKAYDTARQLARSSSGRIPFAPLDSPPWWATVFTSMFMHGGLLHIGFNMLFLWIFGNNVEDAMGRRRFVCFYLLAGIAAAYAQAALDTSGTEPAIGASGAIAGVLGGYLLLHPRARVLTLLILVFFVTLVEVPAVLLLGAWFALQFVPALGQATSNIGGSGGGIAYFAHVGGFLFGLLAIRAFARRARAGPAMAPGR